MTKHTITTGQLWGKNDLGFSLILKLTELCLKILSRAAKPMAVPNWAVWTGLLIAETRARTAGLLSAIIWFPSDPNNQQPLKARLTERDHKNSCA